MKYIYTLINNNNKFNIDYKKSDIKYNNDIYIKYNDNYLLISQKSNEHDEIKYKKIKSLFITEKGEYFFLKKYNMENYHYFEVLGIKDLTSFKIHDISNIYHLEHLLNNMINNKLKKLQNLRLIISNDLYSKVIGHENKTREYLRNNTLLIFIYNLYNFLEIGGNVYINTFDYIYSETIEILYILFSFFEKIIIIEGHNIFCFNYKKNNIKQSKIKEIFFKKQEFNITPKKNIKKLLNYLNDVYINNSIIFLYFFLELY